MSKFTLPHSRGTVMSGDMFTAPWSRFFQDVARRIGSDKAYSIGGRLATNTTAVGNIGAGEDALISYSLEKNTLLNVGDTLEIVAFGSQAANGNNKTIKLIFGTTTLFSTGVVASNAKDWCIRATIIRTAAATQECIAEFNGDTVLVTQTSDYVAGTEDFTTTLTIKCTGEATSNNDIIQKGLFIKLFPTN